jgi:hypothetical protein
VLILTVFGDFIICEIRKLTLFVQPNQLVLCPLIQVTMRPYNVNVIHWMDIIQKVKILSKIDVWVGDVTKR